MSEWSLAAHIPLTATEACRHGQTTTDRQKGRTLSRLYLHVPELPMARVRAGHARLQRLFERRYRDRVTAARFLTRSNHHRISILLRFSLQPLDRVGIDQHVFFPSFCRGDDEVARTPSASNLPPFERSSSLFIPHPVELLDPEP